MNTTGKILVGAMAGLAVGTILGVLYAPDKGSNTRKKIADKGHDLADDLKSKYKEFADSVTEKFHSAKNDIQELAENGKAKYEEVKKDTNNALSGYKS